MKVFFVFCAILATAHAIPCGPGLSGNSLRPRDQLNQCAACKALADPETPYSAFKVSTCEVKGQCYAQMFPNVGNNDDATECNDATNKQGPHVPMDVIGESVVLPVDLKGRGDFIMAMCKCQQKSEMGYQMTNGNKKCYAGCRSVAWRYNLLPCDGSKTSRSLSAAKVSLKGTTFPVANWAQTCKDIKCCTDTDLDTLGAAGFSTAEVAAKKEAMIAAVLAASASAAKIINGKTIVEKDNWKATSIDEFCSAAYDVETLPVAMMGKMVLAMDGKLSGKDANYKEFKAALAAAGLCPTAFRFKTAFRHGQKTTKV